MYKTAHITALMLLKQRINLMSCPSNYHSLLVISFRGSNQDTDSCSWNFLSLFRPALILRHTVYFTANFQKYLEGKT